MAIPAQQRVVEAPATKAASRVRAIVTVEVPVADMRRAVEFYVGCLGFYVDTVKNPLPIEPGNTEVFIYATSGPNIMLVQTDGKERLGFTHKGGANRVLILQLEEEPEACHSRLRAAGYVTEAAVRDSGACGKSFDVRDPDGNVITLWFGHPPA